MCSELRGTPAAAAADWQYAAAAAAKYLVFLFRCTAITLFPDADSRRVLVSVNALVSGEATKHQEVNLK